ncbi:hypothetical protein GPJ56_002871 [Histomonas meleagridis]|uniref:uncharacterized protein n=1 Tax=Histomonas meleagridis TaxID=135588 RepID=UPI003559FCA5|nr:hypothetical protein GPJ56_002871 [Histomonas meleagridis]KAH0800428.1 hypothetical protein GO595_006839 [Histomonas meleagridis]
MADIVNHSDCEEDIDFISKLFHSKYDCVRSFIPKVILKVIKSNESQLIFLTKLSLDRSFEVRYETAQLLKKLDDSVSEKLSLLLIDDANPRIRCLIPSLCSSKSYYYRTLINRLYSDFDWSIRAALSSELIHTLDHDKAIEYALVLICDPCWQVKLQSLRSLRILFQRISPTVRIDYPKLFTNLIEICRYPQLTLKIASSDIIFQIAQHVDISKFDSYFQLFVKDIITRQTSELKLYFITTVINQKSQYFIHIMEPKLIELINELSHDTAWRVREGIVKLFSSITEMVNDIELIQSLEKVCESLIDDEAEHVRKVAVEQLTLFAVKKMDDEEMKMPLFYQKMACSNTFRERQAAIVVIETMLDENGSNKEKKEALMAELERFEDDKCPNVMELAKFVKEKYSNKNE